MKTWKPQIRTKNHTAAPLRNSLGEFAMRCIIRLGSRTTIAEAFPRMPHGRPVIEVNTVEAVENSRNKLFMKRCFDNDSIPQADWFTWKELDLFTNVKTQEDISINNLLELLPSGIIMKRVCGFKGIGMFYIQTIEDWDNFKLEAISRYPNLVR